MYTPARHFTNPLRPWLVAAALVLLLTSVLEAGHLHGVFTELDDHCSLCQHTVALDKTLVIQESSFSSLLKSVAILEAIGSAQSAGYVHFARIRAPPV